MRLLTAVFLLAFSAASHAQQMPSTRPRKLDIPGLTSPAVPGKLTPAATEFYDKLYKVGFHIPEGWNFERKDGVLSNFNVDTGTTRRELDVRGVAAINFNPYPPTTFSGATFYYSVLPIAKADSCLVQTGAGRMKPLGSASVGGIDFQHAHDQHGAAGCIESRIDTFAAMRGHACIRFDLVVNTFCGQTSGSMDITEQQLKDIEIRLANILGSVHFDAK
ncbi:hypothetical protein [Terriglobus saanensis]|uniref:Uncharacterized protein n=1 Tax=Terriglobus saanensis (strain ATCC BAA-1853 / DSM 23119 / SP1PR4) TaxID=401053 RepID=E8V0C8_TERSS|nr:hypothetical protein [Terriglobus saanensis]ADV83346.1 hypothetical protein AciPR4_2568 [Terriglobus saanensis SP1PR4]